MRKHILIFGAGKSATCLIDYILREAAAHDWQVTVADSDLPLAKSKLGGHKNALAVATNVQEQADRQQLVRGADVVISLLPPALHFLIAQDCVLFAKNLLTASYIDDQLRSLQPAIEEKKLLFLCEMGLDPGIDHMSAMQLIHAIKAKGGTIRSFISHCGGLVAPESDDNPWHYKISWNPRNVVMAGKAGAIYRQDGQTHKKEYGQLFDAARTVQVPGIGALAWYPNRDSLDYIPVYDLDNSNTFIRTTLRHPDFCAGWSTLIDLQLTSETILYETNDLTLQAFFKKHCKDQGLEKSLTKKMQECKTFKQQMEWLGLHDDTAPINKGRCSAMDVLQWALEKKLVLGCTDKDMIVMLHEIDYELDGKPYALKSSLLVKGDNNLRTAMAKTVGLPLGIAAKLLLEGKINATGLRIPIIASIYEPVLQELEQQGILFHETQ